MLKEVDFSVAENYPGLSANHNEIINKIIDRSKSFSHLYSCNNLVSKYAFVSAILSFRLTSLQLDHLLNSPESEFLHDFVGVIQNYPLLDDCSKDNWNGFVPACATYSVVGIRPNYLPERIYINNKVFFLEYCDKDIIGLMQTDNGIRKSIEKNWFVINRNDFNRLLNNEKGLRLAGFDPVNWRMSFHDIDFDEYCIFPVSVFALKELFLNDSENVEYLSAEFNIATNFIYEKNQTLKRNMQNFNEIKKEAKATLNYPRKDSLVKSREFVGDER